MRHLVIGLGNLGTDLVLRLRERGEEVVPTSRMRSMAQTLASVDPDQVWFTAGAGGPSEGIDAMCAQVDTNVQTPLELLRRVSPGVRLVFFSTHYLGQDPHGSCSFYAKTKSILEDVVQGHENSICYRVGSLYGKHFPERTFPGKLLMNPEPVDLPDNLVTPTPTDWLASHLMTLETQRQCGLWTVGPAGRTTVHGWGQRITPLARARGRDYRYPHDSSGTTMGFYEGWEKLWGERAHWFIRR